MSEEKKITFEQAMARLEVIVKKMDSGDAMLDESLALFEEGVKLVKFCTAALDHAEQRVKLLQKGADGDMAEADFTAPEK